MAVSFSLLAQYSILKTQQEVFGHIRQISVSFGSIFSFPNVASPTRVSFSFISLHLSP